VAVVPRRSALPEIALALTPLSALLLFLPAGGWLLIALAPLSLWPSFRAAILADRDGERCSGRSCSRWAS
jgi:hypothetical protein